MAGRPSLSAGTRHAVPGSSSGSHNADRQLPPSPRTLHERMGLGGSAPNTLMDRVQGVKIKQENTRTAPGPKTARHIVFPAEKDGNSDSPIVGQDHRISAAATATPLEARIAQEGDNEWPVRGQESTWRPIAAEQLKPSAGSTSKSGDRSLDRETSRHLPSSRSIVDTSKEDVSKTSRTEQQGPIRVSEDGEVWRSPPQRPVRQTSDIPSTMVSRTEFRPPTIPSSSSSFQPISLLEARQQDRSGYSPLPPFARVSSANAVPKTIGRYQGVPPQGFRKPAQYSREASRPPQIASTSGTNRDSVSMRDSYRPPQARRTSQPHLSGQNYQERYHGKEQGPPRNQDRTRSMSHNGHAAESATNTNDTRPTWEDYRSPPILASPGPASKQPAERHLLGEEIPITQARSSTKSSNASWARPLSPRRSTANEPETLLPTAPKAMVADGFGAAQTATSKESQIMVKVSSNPLDTSTASRISLPSGPASNARWELATADRCQQMPTTFKGVVKSEPRSPPTLGPSRLSPPPAPVPQPLFNPPMQSPEERKPVLRRGFTPPPRPRFQVLTSNTSHPRTVPLAQNSSTATLRPGLQPSARDVAQAYATRMNHNVEQGMSALPVVSGATTHLPPSTSTGPSRAQEQPTARKTTERPIILPPTVKREVFVGMGEADMEIDELASSSPERLANPPEQPPSMPAQSNVTSLPQAKASPDALGSRTEPFAEGVSTTGLLSAKGKGRALDTVSSVTTGPVGSKAKSASTNVIHLDDDSEDEVELVSRHPKVSDSRNAPALAAASLEPKSTSANPMPSIPSPSIPAQRPAGEERTRVFPLPPKVLASLQAGGSRPKATLRNFLDERYEQLELELQAPLRRVDEIPRNDTMRLVYVELELLPNEIAIQLPQDCLRSKSSSSEEREARRSAFSIQQVVRFAKEGKEAETTRFTPAYLIVVFKSAQPILPSVGGQALAMSSASTNTPRQPTEKSLPLAAHSALPPGTPTAPNGTADLTTVKIKKKKDKKRKRLNADGFTDDAASSTSVDSTLDGSRTKDKAPVLKQARKSSDVLPNALSSSSSSSLPSFKPSKHTPLLQDRPVRVPPATVLTNSQIHPRLSLGKPRPVSVPHSMHGSLSHKLKDSREKPRTFFRSGVFKNGYVAVSMRGHLHYWKAGMDSGEVVSEDRHTHTALSVQAALWSDEHRLAVLAYISGSAAATASVQLVNLYGSKVSRPLSRHE